MSEPTISIIIPVHNAKTHLAACLESIIKQTFAKWECICVDDGSTDESPQILQNYVEADNRFQALWQKNSGPGPARNAGLKIARGNYITFVDSDDTVHPQLLESLLYLAEKHSADLVVGGMFRFNKDEEYKVSPIQTKDYKTEAEVKREPLLPGMVDWKKFRVHPVGKLYYYEHYKMLRFPPLFGSEDAYLSFDVYARSKCAVFFNAPLYGYRIVETGLTRSIKKYRNYIEGDLEVAIHCHTLCNQHNVEKEIIRRLMEPYVMRPFGFLNQMSVDSRLTDVERKELMELAQDRFRKLKRYVGCNFRLVPPVHYVPYIAIRLRSLKMLKLWQHVRRTFCVIRGTQC